MQAEQRLGKRFAQLESGRNLIVWKLTELKWHFSARENGNISLRLRLRAQQVLGLRPGFTFAALVRSSIDCSLLRQIYLNLVQLPFDATNSRHKFQVSLRVHYFFAFEFFLLASSTWRTSPVLNFHMRTLHAQWRACTRKHDRKNGTDL